MARELSSIYFLDEEKLIRINNQDKSRKKRPSWFIEFTLIRRVAKKKWRSVNETF
jgi:hypothetical protein